MVREGGARVRKPALRADYVVEPSIRKCNTRTLNKASGVARAIGPALDESAAPDDDDTNPFEGFDVPRAGLRDPWMVNEDARLKQVVELCGATIKWPTVAKCMPGRTSKQCRERWMNYVNPDIDRSPFNAAEDITIQMGVLEHGHLWARIAAQLPGRTDNAVKNRYNACLNGLKYNASAMMPVLTAHNKEELKEAAARLDTATLLLELQRRNAISERTPVQKEVAHNTRWTCAEEIRLLEAVREEELQLRIGKYSKWSPLSNGAWFRVSTVVGRTAYACKRHWQLYSSGALAAPVQAARPKPPEPKDEAMTPEEFDQMMMGYETDVNDAQLLCMESLADFDVDDGEDGAPTSPWTNSTIITVGGMGQSFQFRAHRARPARTTQGTPPPTGRRRKPRSSKAEKPSVTGYFAEVKRRDEAEALAKSVFA